MTFKYILSLISPAVMVFSITGMQMGEFETPAVIVKNSTGEEIAIQYQIRGQASPTTITLGGAEEYNVGHSEPLQLLSIMPYNTYKEWLNLHKLTGGYWELKNYSWDIRVAHNKNINTVLEADIISPGAGRPYTLKFNYHQVKQKPIEHHSIFNLFAQVKNAAESGQKIEPRYFLRTRINAPLQEVNAAYRALQSEWLPKALAGDEFAQHVMKFVDAAYAAEIGGLADKSKFDLLVATERETGELFYQ